jgi:hypothetical protein
VLKAQVVLPPAFFFVSGSLGGSGNPGGSGMCRGAGDARPAVLCNQATPYRFHRQRRLCAAALWAGWLAGQRWSASPPNLKNSTPLARQDELGSMTEAITAAMAHMQQARFRLVHQIREPFDNIQHTSSEGAAGNADLPMRTEQAASNLQETAAPMKPLHSTVRQSADLARNANHLAVAASQVAVKRAIRCRRW